jgi:hypothetical protein
VCHRDDQVLAAAGAFSLEQRCENLDDGAERAACDVGNLTGGSAGAVSASKPAAPA